MSVSTLVCAPERFQIFVDALAHKLVWISKRNFTCSFDALRLRADYILVEIEPKIKRGVGLKIKIIIFSNYKNKKNKIYYKAGPKLGGVKK